jgi:O-antigen/teichoic acid export membrane protein
MSTLRRLVGLQGPAGWVFAGRVIGLTAGIVTALVLSRALGAAGRGTVVSFSAMQFLLSSALAVGTGSSVFLLATRRKIDGAVLVASIATMAAAMAAMTTLIAALGSVTGIASAIAPDVPGWIFLLLGPAVGGQYLVISAAQLGMGLARSRAVFATLVAAPVSLATATIVVSLLHPTPERMISAYAAAWLVAAVIGLVALGLPPRLRWSAIGDLLRTGLPAMPGDIANAFSYRADVILLALLSGTSAVGVYSLAVQTLEPLWILASSTSAGLLMTLPSHSRAQWSGDTLRTAARTALLTIGGIVIVLALMPAVVAIAGPSFDATPTVAAVLAPAVLFLAMSKVLSAVQLVAGRLWWSSIVSWSSLAVNIGLNLVLIEPLGATGAALASTGSYLVSACLWFGALQLLRSGMRVSAPT